MARLRKCSFLIAAAVGAALVAGIAPEAPAREDILASRQGQDLARRQVEAAIAFLEFLAAASFSSDERNKIIEEARTAFERNPAGERRGYAAVEAAARRAASFKGDKVREEEFRENAIAAIHLDLLSKPEKERDTATIRSLFVRVPVIAADPTSRHVVTKRGLDALLDANDFVAGVDQVRDKIAADVAAGFTLASADDRYVLAHGASRWARLQIFWSGLAVVRKEMTTDARPGA
jgi:hypothetical protein